METLATKILKRLQELEKSPAAASVEAGLDKSFVRDILNGRKKSMQVKTATELAKVLGWNVSQLLSDDGVESEEMFSSSLPSPSDEHDQPDDAFGIQFGGAVGAGPFRVTNNLDQDAARRVIPIEPDPRYPVADQSACQVEGDSVNREDIVQGMWLHVVSRDAWERRHGSIPDKKLVVAMALRDHGATKELGVKILRLFLDRIELQPNSTNPAHQPWIIPHKREDDNVLVEVIGVVLKAVKLF